MSNIPAQIKRAREEKGLTAAALADLLDVSRQTIWRWENGIIEISHTNKLALETVLGVKFNEVDTLPQAA